MEDLFPKELCKMVYDYVNRPKIIEDYFFTIPSFCWFKTRYQDDVCVGVCESCKYYGKECWESIMITNSWLIINLSKSTNNLELNVWKDQFPKSWNRFLRGEYECSKVVKESDFVFRN